MIKRFWRRLPLTWWVRVNEFDRWGLRWCNSWQKTTWVAVLTLRHRGQRKRLDYP